MSSTNRVVVIPDSSRRPSESWEAKNARLAEMDKEIGVLVCAPIGVLIERGECAASEGNWEAAKRYFREVIRLMGDRD